MKSPNIYIVSLLYLIVWFQEYFWKNIECTLSWNLKLEIKFKSSDNDNLYSFLWNALLKWAIQLNFATCIQCHLWTKTFNLPCRVYENRTGPATELILWSIRSKLIWLAAPWESSALLLVHAMFTITKKSLVYHQSHF